MLKLVIILVLVALTNCQTTSWWPFSYNTCTFGTGGLGANIRHMYVDAVSVSLLVKKTNIYSATYILIWIEKPIYHPGTSYFEIDAILNRAVNGLVNGTVIMDRTVSGLKTRVPCTILPLESGNTQIGSCTYPDLCDLAFSLLDVLDLPDDQCPDYLIENGIKCSCPWVIPAGKDLNFAGELEIPDLYEYGIAWLVSGQFDINVKASASGAPLLCLDLKAGIAPASFTTTRAGKRAVKN